MKQKIRVFVSNFSFFSLHSCAKELKNDEIWDKNTILQPIEKSLNYFELKQKNMKSKVFKIIVITFVLFSSFYLLQGCAVASLPKERMTFSKTSEKGLLVGSVTFPTEKPNFNGYFFRLTNNTSQEFQIDRSQAGQLDEGRTYLFAIERPVGVSEIPSVRLFNNSIIIAGQYDVRTGGFSIPYEIKKGEITYIGNITFNDYAKKGDTVVGLNNKFERDIEELKKLQPTIDWDRAVNETTRKIEYNNKKARL